MLNFIEKQIQKQADKWWEPYKKNHPNFSHWWENMRSNATTVCSDDALGISGLLGFADAHNSFKYMKNEIGVKTELSTIWGATNTTEKTRLIRPLTYTWCGAAYGAGAIDALYQQYHHDMHLGMAVGDWFSEKGDSVHHWYINAKNSIHNWWEHDNHWWE